MAAHNAPSNAYHGSSSLRQPNCPTLGSLRSVVNHADQSPSPASPPKDCRWKRGRPVAFSSHAFSTTPVALTLQADHTAVRPEAHSAQQVRNQQEPGTSLPQSHHRSTGCGGTVAALHQGISAKHPICTAEHDRSTSAHVDPAITFDAPLEEDISELSSADVSSTPSGSEFDASDTDSQAQSSPAGDKTMDDAADTDHLPSSTEQEDAASEIDEDSEEATNSHTSLEFQIPEDLLRAAMSAPDNTKASFWSSNLYRGPEDKRIAVHYCKTKEVAERVAQHFVNQAVLGFDIEWKPYAAASSIKKNVSLIQLACEDRIALFHVALFKGTSAAQLLPPTLKAILESPDIYKVGVAVKGDFSRIIKFLEIEPQGVFELSRLHNLVQFSTTEPSRVTNKLVGLAAQVQQHLQLPLYKGGRLIDDPEDLSNVRSSDWSLPLNIQQIHYAAADAYAGFRLYDALEGKRKQLKPTPPRPLVCDYDSKPKPKTSKLPKKRKTTPKTDASAVAVAGEATAPVEKEEAEEQAGEEPTDTQETEGYETAQEELIDSHQLEGEEPESAQESYEETSDSENDLSIDSVPPVNERNVAVETAPSQKRVGCIDLSGPKGPDPEYPILPDLGGEQATFSSEGASVSDPCEEDEVEASSSVAKVVGESDSGSDEFEDSELEEALRGLDIDRDGKLRGDVGLSEPYPLPRSSPSTEPQKIEEPVEAIDKHEASETTRTPEYNLATSWAQRYLASTIPSPTAHTPSHIRATVPHLRAYSLWRHQGLSMSEIARRLCDPPLAESTVGSYVLQAIVLERMEYDDEEVRKVLMGMPEAMRRGKWRGLAEKVGAN